MMFKNFIRPWSVLPVDDCFFSFINDSTRECTPGGDAHWGHFVGWLPYLVPYITYLFIEFEN